MPLCKLQAAFAALLALGALTIVSLYGQDATCRQEKAAVKEKGLPDIQPGFPKGWFGGAANFEAYQVGLDRKVVKEGKASAYARMKGSNAGEFGTLSQSVLAKAYKGKRLRLTAQVKAEDVADGVSLWMRIDGADATLALDNMAGRRLSGNKDWTRMEIVLDIPEKAVALHFGLLLVGDGKAWVDDFKLEVVARDVRATAGYVAMAHGGLTQAGIPSRPVNLGFEEGLEGEWKGEPLTKEEAAWLKEAVVRFDTAEPGKGFDDLKGFKALVGDARVVALGEGTHGTREFFQMKHRLTEYLASEAGFTHFAIEANQPEAYRVNEYVLGGKGDARGLLKGMYFWTWNTQEVLDMIEWMRTFNASGKGKMQFLGFDMQTGAVAVDNVKKFVAKVDSEYAKKLDTAYEGLADYWGEPKTAQQARKRTRQEKEEVAGRAKEVVKHLEGSREAYRKKEKVDVVERAIQDARVAAQAAQVQYRGGGYRDECMAENVGWILGQAPKGSKVVLWAHNGHVARQPGTMGSHLDKRFGKEMVVVGFACHEGTYTAVKRGKGLADDNVLQPPMVGSLEWNLRQTGAARCVLDLRQAARAPRGQWLDRPTRFRMAGALAIQQQFSPAVLAQQYDALIYFEKTTASRCFVLTGGKG